MLKESQRLHYVVTEVQGPSIKSEFTDCKASIQLPMEKVVAQLVTASVMLSILSSIYNSGMGGFGMSPLNLSTLTLPLFYFLCFGFPKERLHMKSACIP